MLIIELKIETYQNDFFVTNGKLSYLFQCTCAWLFVIYAIMFLAFYKYRLFQMLFIFQAIRQYNMPFSILLLTFWCQYYEYILEID